MPDSKLCSGDIKQGWQISSGVRKAVGELNAIVCPYALHPNASAGVPLEQLLQEIRRRKGVLLRIGS